MSSRRTPTRCRMYERRRCEMSAPMPCHATRVGARRLPDTVPTIGASVPVNDLAGVPVPAAGEHGAKIGCRQIRRWCLARAPHDAHHPPGYSVPDHGAWPRIVPPISTWVPRSTDRVPRSCGSWSLDPRRCGGAQTQIHAVAVHIRQSVTGSTSARSLRHASSCHMSPGAVSDVDRPPGCRRRAVWRRPLVS